ncbi:hypothetical protein [Variovorax sp. J31P179]|uniref:hypothetical protein n=1 Tax=Variovorax sp. J31P179 TaxID=3053508 RepID=UPI0025764227|nr:hypothetical protein [Variovorax sp. J31P179]
MYAELDPKGQAGAFLRYHNSLQHMNLDVNTMTRDSARLASMLLTLLFAAPSFAAEAAAAPAAPLRVATVSPSRPSC